MALGYGRWGLQQNHKHRRKSESSSVVPRYRMHCMDLLHSVFRDRVAELDSDIASMDLF